VAVVGVGAMGSALVEGLLAVPGARPELFAVADKVAERLDRWRAVGVRVTRHAEEAVAEAEVVILAVKPKDVPDVVGSVQRARPSRAIIVSVLAGVPLAILRSRLREVRAIVRAMPNLPVAVRRGVTAIAADDGLDKDVREHVECLFRGIGSVVWVHESLLDGVTALSGSGPAYVYTFLEGLVAAGESLGLDPMLAHRLVIETALGAATLARSCTTELGALREAVTSPQGTTAAALAVLEEAGFRKLIASAVRTAAGRAADLAEASRRALAHWEGLD
jgi:pyrroline-5-carboxylate reductase